MRLREWRLLGRKCWETEKKRQKKDVWKFTKKRECLKVISKQEEVHEQFGRKINQDVNGNRKLFWKGVSMVNGGELFWKEVSMVNGGK